MSDQEQSVSQEQPTSTEPTLEQVYTEFKVDDVAQSFQPQAQPSQQPRQEPQPSLSEHIPDPVMDAQGFKAWQSTQNKDIRQALSSLHAHQQALAVAEIRRQEEADIKTAVSTVKEKVGGDIDDDFIEIALGQKARKDAKFNAIWMNRHKNPQAFRAALNAVGNEFKGKFQYRQDPQLTENARAAKQSTQSSLTTKEDPTGNPLEQRLAAAKSPQEFERIWQQSISGGY